MTRNPKLDPVNGRFLPNPIGQKTEKMLREEARLGVRFEDDYLEKVKNGDWGQKRFSKRWHVGNRSLIFGRVQEGRRSWIEMLGLPRAGHNPAPPKGDNAKTCARCHADVPLERAHWIARRDSGPSDSWNLVDLCPNCHTLLDNGDEDVVREVKEIVLLKAVRKLLEQSDELALRKELVDTCTAITMRQAKI